MSEHGKVADDVGQDGSALAALKERIRSLEERNRSLEDQVAQLHRVKSMVDLIGGVAHDLSSALTGIVWCSEAVKTRMAAYDADLVAGLGDFVQAADYARRLARRLLSLGRSVDREFAPREIQLVIEEACNLAQSLCPREVTFRAELSAEDAWVLGSGEQLLQVVVNLTTNAFDALRARGGHVTVSLARAGRTGQAQGSTVVLSVQDDGHGMSEATLARAFEPFFTTKGGREGNGLGLSVVRTIVERHGGHVRIVSGERRGTTVTATLPTCEAPSE